MEKPFGQRRRKGNLHNLPAHPVRARPADTRILATGFAFIHAPVCKCSAAKKEQRDQDCISLPVKFTGTQVYPFANDKERVDIMLQTSQLMLAPDKGASGSYAR
jgi:hypothetical protein